MNKDKQRDYSGIEESAQKPRTHGKNPEDEARITEKEKIALKKTIEFVEQNDEAYRRLAK